MRTALMAWILAATLTAAIGCNGGDGDAGPGWRVQGLDGVRVPHPDSLSQVGLRYYWHIERADLDAGERIADIHRLDENLYVVTDRNRVIAYSADVGAYKWSAWLAEPPMPIFPPAHDERVLLPPNPGEHYAVNEPDETAMTTHNLVAFCTLNYATILDRDTGREIERVDFDQADFVANSGPAMSAGILYVGTVRDPMLRGRFFAMDLVTGMDIWSLGAEGPVAVAPQVYNEFVIVASREGALTAAAAGVNPGRIWRQQADGGFLSDFWLDRRGLFIGSLDYSVYAFDPITGARLWQQRCEGAIRRPVLAGRSNCYAYAEDDRFYALDLATGDRKWTLQTPATPAAEFEDAALLAGDAELLTVDPTTGEVLGRTDRLGLDLIVPGVGPAAYVASEGGFIGCIRPEAAGYVAPSDLPPTR